MKNNFVKIATIFLFFCFEFFNPAYAYIDPGTGSMLFSLILGILTTLFFIIHTVILNLKINIFKNNSLSKNHNKFVIYSEGNQYYCVFRDILYEFEKRKIPVLYLTSFKDDLFLKEKFNYIKTKYIGEGNRAYFKLAFLNADVCLMTTPHLDVLQLKRSKFVKHYSHILHSITFSVDYRIFALDYYDSVLCDSDFQIPLIRELETKRNLQKKECPIVGSTYMDYYQKLKNNLSIQNNNNYTILIAPSWGVDGMFNTLGEKIIDNLMKTKYKIVIRPHPQSMIVEKEIIKKLINKYQNCENISWNFDKDNIEILSKADILISDFSCVMFDYAFLFNKPFLYLDTNINKEIYDYSDLDEIPYRYKIINKIGRKISEEEVDKIDKIIEEFKTNTLTEQEIIEAKNYSWKYQGEASKKVVNFLIEKQKEVAK